MTSPVNALVKATNIWDFVITPAGKMFVAKNDDGIALRFYHGMTYDTKASDIWGGLCKGAEIVIDVGAHTGFYSLLAYKSGAKRVISVEPYMINYARLAMNLRANGWPVSGCRYVAASDMRGMVKLSIPATPHYCSTGCSVYEGDKRFGSSFVEMVLLDDLIDPSDYPKVNAIKIDVEGAAHKVLQGMPKLLDQGPDIIIEVDDPYKTTSQAIQKTKDIFNLLEGLGYVLTKIEEDHPVFPSGELDIRIPNYYATRRS